MLTEEQAGEALKKFAAKKGGKACRDRFAAAPGKLREPAFALLGRNRNGKKVSDWSKLRKLHKKAGRALDTLTTKERSVLFKTLNPRLAPYLERGWEMLKTAPYQRDYVRKGFRAPHDETLTSAARFDWLETIVSNGLEYDQEITWFAEWFTHLNIWSDHEFGILFAAAIDSGGAEGDRVFEILRAAANGEHETAAMGRHICYAFLSSSRVEAWEFMERFLLAAQRQEGLRQSILESVDLAHPEAFRRILKLILDENLVRFSSVVRAADVWFGLAWDSVSTGVVKKTISQVLAFLEDPSQAEATIAKETQDAEAGEKIYLALWTLAFEDAFKSIPKAADLMQSGCTEVRFAAAVFLWRLYLKKVTKAIIPGLEDPDLRIASLTVDALDGAGPKTFDRIEAQMERFPDRPRKLESLIWPWVELKASKAQVAGALFTNLGDRHVERLLPHLGYLDSWGRARAASLLAKSPAKLSPEGREILVNLMKDASPGVREEAVSGVAKLVLTEEEIAFAEGLLTRKASDLRRGMLQLIMNLPPEASLQSASRLLGSGKTPQRLAGLELLRLLIENEDLGDQCILLAESFVENRKKLTKEEERQLDAIRTAGEKPVTLEDGLGLMNPANLTLAEPPRRKKFKLDTPAALGLIRDLDELVHSHRKSEITCHRGNDDDDEGVTQLLGEIQWGFPTPEFDKPIADQLKRLPLREIWETWMIERPAKLRDRDNLELLRAVMLMRLNQPDKKNARWIRTGYEEVHGDRSPLKIQYPNIVQDVLWWLILAQPKPEMADLVLDAAETELAAVPLDLEVKEIEDSWSYFGDEEEKKPKEKKPLTEWDEWRGWCSDITQVFGDLNFFRNFFSVLWTATHDTRFFQLSHWWDMPTRGSGKSVERIKGAGRERVDSWLLAKMHTHGKVNEDDVVDHLLGPRGGGDSHRSEGFWGIQETTARKIDVRFNDSPGFLEIAARCVERALEVELSRGEHPGPATDAVTSIRYLEGTARFIAVVSALGKDNLHRTWSYHNTSRQVVFSELFRSIFPAAADTPDSFSAAVEQADIPEARLIQIALFAPQWVDFVDAHLGWDGFADAVWWIHAHAKDEHWTVDQEVRELWAAQIAERTGLSSDDLVDGAVDVEWFQRVYKAMGKRRWLLMSAEARYASGGNGHRRAQVFAEAMLGQLKKTEMLKRIRTKRHQDMVRALGLLPLARGTRRDSDLLSRYRELQEFVRTSRQFGSQRQTSEKRAAAIGQENLARTAGYPDPIRLQWDMEAREISDMKGGFLEAKSGDVEVRLTIGEYGDVSIGVVKNGKTLKAIPAAARKDKAIKALTERRTQLKRQGSRIRKSLEEMMCRGDSFSRDEIGGLMDHPLLAPMLRGLVLVSESGGGDLIGYPAAEGKLLEKFDGSTDVIGKTDRLRIAHPHDFLATGQWSKWQRDCLARERIQPFKQVFRELYPLTKDEKKKGEKFSRRYAGHQVNPRQAMALFGSRGWLAAPEEGVRRTFHREELTACTLFEETFYTPAEVEGLTLAGIQFFERGTHKPIAPSKVPPRLFSEVMRDLDLVVSVAHRGGVDPEASTSTVEMRSQLIGESAAVLGLKNVRVKGNHALIKGKLGEYSVHLGSAGTHLMPGGALFIVPVQAQHRGRIFLPFADDDPKTAEVLTKVILLSRDGEIKDPAILEQIRARKVR